MKQDKKILMFFSLCSLILIPTCLSFADASTEKQIWPSWVKLGGKAGDSRELGTVDIFVPFLQTESNFWFVNARDKDASGSENEWNLGLGYRRLIKDKWILGLYGFFDNLRSQYGNDFSQCTFGIEALTKDLDFRLNSYFPDSKEAYTGNSSIIVSGHSINLGNGEEQALPGFDAEIGFRIPKIIPEIRVYAGGFYFDRSDVPKVAGPRVRTEWRINDFLGFKGTRLAIEGEYTYDDIRRSKSYIGASVRIPLGFSARESMAKNNSLEARMVEPIIRDVDIITSPRTKVEPAINPSTGQPYSGIWFAAQGGAGDGTQDNPTNLLDAVSSAGINGIVAALDSAGTIDVSGLLLQEGQTLIGSGGELRVFGPTGHLTAFNITGDSTTITDSSGGEVITLANDNLISDITVDGGGNGIVGNGISNAFLSNVTVKNVNNCGAYFSYVGNVNITNSHFDNNDYGLVFDSGIAGDVTLNNVSADYNYYDNIYLYDIGYDSDQDLYTGGNVLIQNTTANGSYDGYGIYIDDVYSSQEDGSKGNITLTNVNANNNYYDNLYIDYVGGDLTIDPSSFSYSENGNGMGIYNVNGNVQLRDVTSNGNSIHGARIFFTTGDINIDGSHFDYNYNSGIAIRPAGNVTIADSTANGNYNSNIMIGSVNSLVITDSQANSSANACGMFIRNIGDDVTLNNVTANNNYDDNLYIDNVSGDVSIDPSSFSYSQNGNGISIYSTGDVLIEDAVVNDNADNGIRFQGVNDVLITGNTEAIANSNYDLYFDSYNTYTIGEDVNYGSLFDASSIK